MADNSKSPVKDALKVILTEKTYLVQQGLKN